MDETIKSTAYVLKKKTPFAPSGNCHSCGSLIEREASVVGDFNYHPSCFKCQGCERPLANEQYYIIEGGNYCNGCRDVSFRTMLLHRCILSMISWAETSTKVRLNQVFRTYYKDKEGWMTSKGIFPCLIRFSSLQSFLEKCHRCGDAIVGDTVRPRENGQPYHPACFTCNKYIKSTYSLKSNSRFFTQKYLCTPFLLDR